jgi:hypothetical protein
MVPIKAIEEDDLIDGNKEMGLQIAYRGGAAADDAVRGGKVPVVGLAA